MRSPQTLPSTRAAVSRGKVREPTRVFHLIKSLGRGGAETLLFETLRFGDRERFEYEYGYFLPWKNAMVPALELEGARVSCFSASNNLSILLAAKRVADRLRRSEVDLLHCHLPIAGVVGRLAGKLAGVPVVYTEHNKLERYHPLTRRLNLASWGWQERVIAVSEDVAESARTHAGEGVRIEVILNGVDVDRFDRKQVDPGALRQELGIPSDAPVVGTVAVFRAQKRLDAWLDAATAILESHPDAHFLMVGDGPLRSELVEQAAALGLGDAVHWVGLQPDVRAYLAAMDVYLMSSSVEGLPIALLEAMSMECAVVSTAVGGIPELVQDGRSGLLVLPERRDLLTEAVRSLLDSPARMRSLGAAARRTVQQGFSIERMTRQLETVYRDVVRGRRGG